MNLKQAQEHLLRDAKYRQQYEKHKDGVELAMHAVAVRKELGISHLDLARELGISRYDISKFENLKGRVEPWIISTIVARFQNELRERGIRVDKWFVARPSPAKPEQRAVASGKASTDVQSTRRERGRTLPNHKQRQSPREVHESKV